MTAPLTPRTRTATDRDVPRRVGGVDPFTAGMLVAGLAVGAPVAVAVEVAAGHPVRGLVVPAAAVLVTGWLWRRTRGWPGLLADLRTPLVRRPDLAWFVAGAMVAVLAIAATLVRGGSW